MTSLELYGIVQGVEQTADRAPAVPRVESNEGARRVLNAVVAALGLVVTAPLMLVIAILVKLTSPGPVLYRQMRVGIDRRSENGGNHRRKVDLGGQPFQIYKFRTMTVQQNAAQVWASKNDARVTRIGRVLRQYRLDELPQLWNVLKGDMNVVGPRPEQPVIFADLRNQVERYGERQRVRPGITGWAQINHHYDQSIDDVRTKVAYDLEYIARQSVMEDFRIMLRTGPVLLFRKGAW